MIPFLLWSWSMVAVQAAPVQPLVETLPSGARIVWFESPRLPVFDLVYVSSIGSKADPAGRSGILEMLGATMPRGAAGRNAQDLARSLERLGSGLDFRVGEDFTTVGVHGLSEDWEPIATTWADVILRPDFAANEVSREKSRLLERWSHLPDQTESLAAVAFVRLLMRGTPYGRGNLLSRAEIQAIGIDDLKAAHTLFRDPHHALILVVGSVPHGPVKAWLSERFGGAVSAPSAVPAVEYTDRRLPEPKAGDVILIHRPKTNQSQVRIGYSAPPPGHADHAAFQVLCAALGEHFGSRLNRVVRDELGLTYSISSNILSLRERTFMAVSASTHNPQVGELLKQTRRLLEETAQSGITEEELSIAQSYLAGSFPLSVSTLTAFASRWVGAYLFGLGEHHLDGVVSRIQGVTLAQVNQVARTWLKGSGWWVVAGDSNAVSPVLQAAGFQSVKPVKVADLL